jgi:hypothetical protein
MNTNNFDVVKTAEDILQRALVKNTITHPAIPPLSKEHGFSIHTHKANSLGVHFYSCYLDKYKEVTGDRQTS